MTWTARLLACFLAASTGGADIALAESGNFDAPSMRGVRLDWCKHWGNECGKPAADLFCRENGFVEAARFAIDKNAGARAGRTLVFGDGRLCEGAGCDGFSTITCSRPDRQAAPTAPPSMLALPPLQPAAPPPSIMARPTLPVAPTAPPPMESIAPIAPAPPAISAVPIQPAPFGPAMTGPVAPLPRPNPGLRPPVQPGPLVTVVPTLPPKPFLPPPAGMAMEDLAEPDRVTVPTTPPSLPVPGMAMETPPQSGTVMNACQLSPESCCPQGQKSTEGCGTVARDFLDIRIRSYVPPRFTVLGKHYPVANNWSLANIVADVNVGGPYKVWPGCRFNVTAAKNKISDSKNVLEQAGALAEAWFKQWSGGVEAAKGFVADNIADGVCSAIDNSKSCRDTVAGAVKTAINVGLASLGIPPEIPDIQQLREHGINYLAAQAASYAVGEADALLQGVPVNEALRQQLYDKAYDEASKAFAAELNKVVPPANFNTENPATWGHLEPAYAPHHAHLYIEVRVRPLLRARYLDFIAGKPTHKWVPLHLHDLNLVFAGRGPIEIPTFIPSGGVILPIELKPYDVAYTKADTAPAQIPGTDVSWAWLRTKFGINDLVRPQYNFKPMTSTLYIGSDWDLFYEANGRSNFRLLSPYGGKVIDWENGPLRHVGVVWDAVTGGGVRVKAPWERNNQMKNYYGRIDPAPRCDGKPNLASFE